VTANENERLKAVEVILEQQERRLERMEKQQEQMVALLNQAKGFRLAGFFLIGAVGFIGGTVSQWLSLFRVQP